MASPSAAFPATAPVIEFHRSVAGMCAARVRDALNPGTALFDRQLRDGRWDATLGTEDVTSTAIVLIGVHRAGVPPASIGLSPARTFEALAAQARRRAYPGGHGLVLWAHAAWDLWPARKLDAALGVTFDHPDGWVPRLTTMETAWLVSGLAHRARRGGGRPRDALARIAGVLRSRFDARSRLFRHADAAAPLAHRVRRWIANFADQVYSVQALSFASIVLGDSPSRDAAEACAARIVELQGPLGQWPWQYDVRRGCLASFFPVYSVHQHGMAPMALFALAAAGGKDHRDAVERSVAWISDNEAGVSMLDEHSGTIWRDVAPVESAAAKAARRVLIVAGRASPAPRSPRLAINRETRPYEWAWCLYAGAIAAGTPTGPHVV